MALAHREATVVWEGTLGSGQGTLSGVHGSDALDGTTVDWAGDDADADGTTSPEQLLAAAEAGCYAMTLALALARRGRPAERLTVNAACELDRAPDADPHEYTVTALTVDVEGEVPGLDEDAFAEAARHADEQCPISNAVRGSVQVRLNAKLAPS
jgi:osmotically inducible protein OsmC